MKLFGLVLSLALVAVAMQAAPYGSTSASNVVIAGIDAGGGPQAVCDQADDPWTSGCQGDESKRIVVASITGTGSD